MSLTVKKKNLKTRLFPQKTFFQIFVKNSLTNELGIPGVQFLNFYCYPSLILPNRIENCFHPITFPGYPFSHVFFRILKNGHKKKEGQIIRFCIAFLAWPNLTGLTGPHSPLFHPITPPVGFTIHFGRNGFVRTTYPEKSVFGRFSELKKNKTLIGFKMHIS